MTTDQIKSMQNRLGITSDGFWGPKSTATCQAWLRKRMPSPHPWPETYEWKLASFYGSPGDESMLVNLDVIGLGVLYERASVKTIRCHGRVAESLHRVLTAVHASAFAYILEDYAGCFNDRPMRGGTAPSLHSHGAAIDLRPGTNGNLDHWPDAADMPLEVMAMFAAEGWLAAGANWGRDAMHFQATR